MVTDQQLNHVIGELRKRYAGQNLTVREALMREHKRVHANSCPAPEQTG